MALVENKTMGARAVFAVALLLFSVFGMGGCSGEVTVDQKFVNLFVELRIVEMTYGKEAPMTRLVRQELLKEAGYTREQFFAKTVNARIDSLLALPAEKANAPEIKPSRKLQTQMPAHKGGVK